MSDAFIVYKQLTRNNPDLLHCLCWAHVHNKFAMAAEVGKEEDAVWFDNLMVTALNYMLNGWDELLRSALPLCFVMNYRKDGRYTIDNLEAERAVRPFTRIRKASLQHGSEEGLQMALAYMTIIETAKRLGHEVKDFLVRAWREAIYGNNNLEPLLQPAIAAR